MARDCGLSGAGLDFVIAHTHLEKADRQADSAALRCRFGLPLAGFRIAFRYVSQKIQKTSESVLTLRRGADYIRLTNEGGAPLATKEFAPKSALVEFQESRVSDTLPAPKPKA